MRIGILGAGAVGCYVGGRLLQRGAKVTFVARARGKQELEEHGLALQELGEAAPAAALHDLVVTTDPRQLAGSDVILVCVKSGQTREVARSLDAPGAIVVSLQNGVHNAQVLREELPGQTVLAAIVGFNVVADGAGTFRQGTSGPLVIEEHPVLGRLAPLLADFELEREPDIRGKQWSKLLMNLLNAVGALTDVPTPQLLFDARYRRVAVAVLDEALGVLRAAGIRPARLGAIPAALFPWLLRLPTPLLKLAARAQLKMDPNARSSMWQDLDKRRRTEVEELNGEIVRLAAKHGVAAPVNACIVQLIHDAEAKGEGSPGLAPERFAF